MLRVDSKPNYDAGKIKLEDENGSGDLKITKEQIKVFKRELKKMRKQYPGVPLVEIRESGGNGVSIYP